MTDGIGAARVGGLSDGWVDAARRCPSPNCDTRPVGCEVDMIVIHAISLPPDEFGGPGIEQLFTNRLSPDEHPYYAAIHGLRVSAHFLVRRDGEVVQFVPTNARAWHAGASSWQGRSSCNDFSIGIELEGCDSRPFTCPQYRQLGDLVGLLYGEYPIAHVVGHSDISPGRKTDPGPCFDWSLFRQSLTVSPALRGCVGRGMVEHLPDTD